MHPVTPFDLARYEGRWYEVARLDHSFERGMTDVSATYQRQSDGSVRCSTGALTPARTTGARPKAKPCSPAISQHRLAQGVVLWPVLRRLPRGRAGCGLPVGLVVGPDRSYCWILSRTRQLPPALREQLIARAKALGIDTQALIWVTHDRTDPQP